MPTINLGPPGCSSDSSSRGVWFLSELNNVLPSGSHCPVLMVVALDWSGGPDSADLQREATGG